MYPTGDLNQDGIVDSIDLSILVSNWNTADPDSDINNDGIVDSIDLSILVGNWGETAAASGTALLVTNETELSTQNQPLYDRLVTLGYSVITRLDSDPVDYDGIDLVVFGTVTNSNVDGRYTNPPVGMVFVDSFRHFGLGSSIGFENNVDTLEVTNSAHPLSGGLSNGNHVVYNTPGYLVWSTDYNQDTAIIIATNPGEPTNPIIFAYEAGSMMATEYATTRHIGLGLHKDVRHDLTTAGWALFDAAVTWAAASSYIAPPPPSAPANVVASASNEQATISWDSVSSADSYTIKRSTTDGGPYTTIETNITTTSYTDTNLTNGTTYYYVISATNAQGESPDSSQVSATPIEGSGGGGVERLGLHVTAQELAVWRDRWDNGVTGDSFLNARIDAEKSYTTNDRNTFASNPSAQIFEWYTDYPTSDGCVSGQRTGGESANRRKAVRVQQAAWYGLVHEDIVLLEQVRDHLVDQLSQPNTYDFHDSVWCGNSAGMRSGSAPGFEIAHGLMSLLFAYDYVRIAIAKGWLSDWSSANKNLIQNFYLGFAQYCYEEPRDRATNFFEDFDNGDYTFTRTDLWSHPLMYDGGPDVGTVNQRWNNRNLSCVRAFTLIGLVFDSATYLDFGEHWLQVFPITNIYPDGCVTDFHRGDSLRGLGYPMRQFAHGMHTVDVLARAGRRAAIDTQTTEGGVGSQGAPSDGFPNPEQQKSWEFFAASMCRYSSKNAIFYNRTRSGALLDWDTLDSSFGANRGRNDQLLFGNLYWQRSDVEQFYRAQLHPFNIDSLHQNNNDSGCVPAPYLMWAGLEGQVWPYPGVPQP